MCCEMYIFVWNLYMLGINNNNNKVTYNFTCMCNRQGSRPIEIAFQHDHYSELQRPVSNHGLPAIRPASSQSTGDDQPHPCHHNRIYNAESKTLVPKKKEERRKKKQKWDDRIFPPICPVNIIIPRHAGWNQNFIAETLV